MKQKDAQLLAEAEAFVRKAMSHISTKPVSEKTVRAATLKVAKAIPAMQENNKAAA